MAIRGDRSVGSVPVGCGDVNLDCLLENRLCFIDDHLSLWSESMANKERERNQDHQLSKKEMRSRKIGK